MKNQKSIRKAPLLRLLRKMAKEKGVSVSAPMTEISKQLGGPASKGAIYDWLSDERIKRYGLPKPKAVPIIPKPKAEKPIKQTPAELRKAFYDSEPWQALRYLALKRSDGACNLCGRSRRAHGVVLHVDHIKPRSKFPELELDINNLQVLCKDCNLGKSNKDDTDWRPQTSERIVLANGRNE